MEPSPIGSASKRVRRAALALLLAVSTAACIPGRDGENAKPRRGGTLRVAVSAVGSLDPGQARDFDSTLIADQLFDALTALDPQTLEPVPAIAARWTVSADQRQWDFFLRPDAKFSNGRPVNAGDVKYTLERVARRGSGLAGADLLESISGYAPFAKAGTAPGLAGITTPAPNHVHFSLDQPLSVLPSVLAAPALGIVPRESVEVAEPARPFVEEPVTSGPFKFSARRAGAVSLLPARSSTLVDVLEFVEFGSLSEAYAAFERGEVDWARVPPERVEDAAGKHGTTGYVPYAGELLYGFNMRNPKFADSRVRQAIMLAIDRHSLVRAIYGTTVLPIDGIVVEGIPGHQADACGSPCGFDLARAKALMADARSGLPPLEIFIDFDNDLTQEAVAKALKTDLAPIGVNATLRPHGSDYGQFALSGQQELFRLGWIAPYASPDAFLAPMFSTGSANNFTGHSLPAVDEQIRAARANPDSARRAEQYQSAERAVMSSLPVIPIAQLQVQTVSAKKVRGLKVTAMGTFDASIVWLTKR